MHSSLLASGISAAFLLAVVPAVAQSPNTASIRVLLLDQTGAVVPGARVSITNDRTSVTRTAISGDNGYALIAALPVTGAYTVTVDMAGFTAESARNIALRAGETANVRITLVASGGTSQVTVYGTVEGVRNDPQLGTRFDSRTIEETPLLGRKLSYLPLLNAAFRQAKGTGDLFMNSVYAATGAGGRRQTDYVVDGASADEPWGRQTIFSTLPVAAVEEITVMTSAFSAEFGWTSSTAVNIVTKSGTDTAHGEVLALGRPGGLQSDSFSPGAQCPSSIATCVPPGGGASPNEMVAPDIPDSLIQGSLAVGGPLMKDRSQYFVATDATGQARAASITTPLVPAGAVYVGHYRQFLLNGRADYKVNGANSLMARLNLDRFFDTNPQDAVSGTVLPSAGRQFARHAWGAQLNETAVLSPAMVNEVRLEFQNADPVTSFDPLTPSTQYTRAGSVPFTSGESRYAHVFSRVSQLSDTLTWTRDKHYVRTGGAIGHNTSGGDGTEFGSAFVLGQYTVDPLTTKPPGELQLSDMQRYQQSFTLGVSTYELRQWLMAAFVQDSYRLRHDLTLDVGLRYDLQTFSDGRKNLAPRVGFAWNPNGDPKTIVRGGFGDYYTMLRANTDASFELGGPLGIFTYAATPGQTGFPPCLTCTPLSPSPVSEVPLALNTLPPRNITIRPGRASHYSQFFDISKLPAYAAATFVNPKSQVGSIGFERDLHGVVPGMFVSVDYVKQHWDGLDRSVDLNAPSFFGRSAPEQVRSASAADTTRPIAPTNGGYRQINVVENLGVADYDGLQTAVRWRNDRAFVSLSYTLSKATNTTEPDGNGAGQNDFNQLGEEERGPSLLDQRHRAVFAFSYRLAPGPGDLADAGGDKRHFRGEVVAGTVVQLASARPFNATTGVDNNGDGNNNDRPVINGGVVGRDGFRGTPTSDVAVFGDWTVKPAGLSLTLRAEAFNLFNHANVLGRNGTYGDGTAPLPTFGQAGAGLASLDPGRQVQFQVRFKF